MANTEKNYCLEQSDVCIEGYDNILKDMQARFLSDYIHDVWQTYTSSEEFTQEEKTFEQFIARHFRLYGSKNYPDLIRKLLVILDEIAKEISMKLEKELVINYTSLIRQKEKETARLRMFIDNFLRKPSIKYACSPSLPIIISGGDLKRNWITIDEAAAFLGLSESSVRYYRDKGMLIAKKEKGIQKINVESLVVLKSLREEKETEEENLATLLRRKDNMDALISVYDHIEQDLDVIIKEYQTHMVPDGDISNDIVRKRITFFIESFRGLGIIKDRNLNIVIDLLTNPVSSSRTYLADIGKKYHLTPSRLRQIMDYSLAAMRDASMSYPSITKTLALENNTLREEISMLSKELSEIKLKESAKDMQDEGDVLHPQKENSGESLRKKIMRLDSIELTSLGFHVRVLNTFRAAEIKTLYDLVRQPREHLLKFRNFGKKSMKEIEDTLSAMGLELGMRFDFSDLPGDSS